MTKVVTFAVAILTCCFARAQPPEAMIRRIPLVAPTAQPVIDLGEVVINVVIAKVQTDGSEPELLIAKFGGKEAIATRPRTVTTYTAETRTRIVNVNGEKVEQTYTVQVPVTQVVQQKENFTPTENERSVPVNMIQAFDLKGKRLDQAVWTKHLETPKHVLLLREPLNESNRLNPFYASLLREDTLLLFLASKEGLKDVEQMIARIYRFPASVVWQKDGKVLDPMELVELIKSKVTPNEWQVNASIVASDSNLEVSANAITHGELISFLKQLREDMVKAKEEK